MESYTPAAKILRDAGYHQQKRRGAPGKGMNAVLPQIKLHEQLAKAMKKDAARLDMLLSKWRREAYELKLKGEEK
jgi:hypothetical protein